jgi:hypothetical protein
VLVDDDVFGYERQAGDERVTVLLNLSAAPRTVRLPQAGAVLLSTHLDHEGATVSGEIQLRADEGVLIS